MPISGNEADFKQPWSLPEHKIVRSANDFLNAEGRFLFSNFSLSKGLGNLMWQYASLSSLAADYKAKIVLPESCLLRRAFNLSDENRIVWAEDSVVKEMMKELRNETINLKSCCSHPDLAVFVKNPKFQVVNGFFQNLNYFHPKYSRKIKNDFTFLKPIEEQAAKFLKGIMYVKSAVQVNNTASDTDKTVILDGSTSMSDIHYVGIHVRRGMDILVNQNNVRHGHLAAPFDYYLQAMRDLSQVKVNENLVYIVCSDDMNWSRKAFKNKENIHFCPGPREVDMAILSRCDSLIGSTGTFTWWSAYLNRNKYPLISYYAHWPNPNSQMDKMINKTEYFLPNWVSFKCCQ
ncbi:hypothetical protein WR25_18202 isoform A [Diploscapter pachys]|uniref:L-Fucosyltransferase n=1 Tax=Diploscapter pachys TaxID=2018661 RepID=A0A2A2JIB9_9BILA|nr:hypothetical protein WR25_18202 isoform A [Diploscapter pachys]